MRFRDRRAAVHEPPHLAVAAAEPRALGVGVDAEALGHPVLADAGARRARERRRRPARAGGGRARRPGSRRCRPAGRGCRSACRRAGAAAARAGRCAAGWSGMRAGAGREVWPQNPYQPPGMGSVPGSRGVRRFRLASARVAPRPSSASAPSVTRPSAERRVDAVASWTARSSSPSRSAATVSQRTRTAV